MHGCISQTDRSGKKRSNAIDRMLEKDKQKAKGECKILILGTRESGKTTIVNQMRILHQHGFSDAELAAYRLAIHKNVLDSANAVVVHMKKLGLECVDFENRLLADTILNYHLDLQNRPPNLSPEIAEAIHQVYLDPVFTKIVEEHSSEFNLMDSALYFFSEVLRIGSPGYVPNEDDVLHAHQESAGVTETRVQMSCFPVRMLEVGGQHSERKKWIHHFENITSMFFCASLSEYDQVLLEDETQNRMSASLALFESVINSRWFRRTSIILFLNKVDVFKKKLPKAPLERCFPEYTGGSDFEKAARCILGKFTQTNRARLQIYPHLMDATSMSMIHVRLVKDALKESIMQKALVDAGTL
ncbi:heterotrimeric G-protein alpha subunit, GPA3-like protein [Pholiota molesta]|nr:heterotrimeric G-protein alpha subunit, GPA3-like protein [Pholiota molesta]